jgi:hypothetical protein
LHFGHNPCILFDEASLTQDQTKGDADGGTRARRFDGGYH